MTACLADVVEVATGHPQQLVDDLIPPGVLASTICQP